jgi:CRP/FNR family transcriptional regulator
MRALRHFLATAHVKQFSKNEVIIHQGIETNHIFVVKSGVVSCYDISLDGSQQLIYLASEGEVFPFAHLLTEEEPPRFFYGAFSDIEVYDIEKPKFVEFLKTHPGVFIRVLREASRQMNDFHFRINAVGKPKAREKILHTLAFIADRFRTKRSKRDEVELSLALTHQDIASLVGLTRETTSTTLKQLKDEKIINYDAKNFTVRRDLIEKALWG